MKKVQNHVVLLAAATFFLTVLVVLMMCAVGAIQGNARVVNYAGIVRGATQRLVKNELYGKPDDSEITRLDDILQGLQTGGGTQKLTVLHDAAYLEKLELLSNEWEKVKSAIYAAREDNSAREELYVRSEAYFIMANETVGAAEEYADGIAKRLNILEVLIVADIAFILCALFAQIVSELKANRKLSKMAYVDPNTGLPNKRSCDEKLDGSVLIESGRGVCCLMFDLNNLKKTNDTLGHEAGDALIGSFASMLRRNAPADMFIGRFGGDEFIGIHEHAQRPVIEQFIKVLRTAAETTPVENMTSSIHISFACGYAFSEEHNSCTVQTLMDIADKNMYANKLEMKQH
jgi:diguanylate cyclase (GGDEF)-like protein